jgi:hypothetical protein
MKAFTIHGAENINKVRMLTLLGGLRMEIKGMRMTAKGRTCYSIIKSDYGLKGNKHKVCEQFRDICASVGLEEM